MSQIAATTAALTEYGFTPGRTWSLVSAALGLVGVVAGLLSVRGRRAGAVTALVAGAVGAVGGALVVAAAKGGPGTGYGIVGGYIALVVGAVATGLGALALVRARRTPASR